MRTEYSESCLPAGIGNSFILLLAAVLLCGLVAGLIFQKSQGMDQMGGVPLLVAFLVLLIGPHLYNRRKSRFEGSRKPIKDIESFCSIQELRGTFVRILLYEDGIEIRAFYHRYFLPFQKILFISFTEGKSVSRLKIFTEMDDFPEYIISSGKEFISMALLIRKKFNNSNLQIENIGSE